MHVQAITPGSFSPHTECTFVHFQFTKLLWPNCGTASTCTSFLFPSQAIEPRHLFQCQGTFVGHKVLFYVFSHTVTSFPGPFEKSDIADTLFGPKCAYVCSCTIKTPEVWKIPHSVKWTGSPVPELYQIHSRSRTLVYRFPKNCVPLLVDTKA